MCVCVCDILIARVMTLSHLFGNGLGACKAGVALGTDLKRLDFVYFVNRIVNYELVRVTERYVVLLLFSSFNCVQYALAKCC